MTHEPSKSLPPIEEIFENANAISEGIRQKVKDKELSPEEVDQYILDLKEIIESMESLKASLPKKDAK